MEKKKTIEMNLLKNLTIVTFILSIAFLLIGGFFAKNKVPPIPSKVISPDGTVLMEKSDIISGQNVYQKYGLMDHGSIWGHGSLRGMDFSATTLHMIGEVMRDYYAGQGHYQQGAFSSLEEQKQSSIKDKVIKEIHSNRYDSTNKVLTLTDAQVKALQEVRNFWNSKFSQGYPQYGFLPNTIPDEKERIAVSNFFFWTAWAAGTNREGMDFSYTNNWPFDPSVGNTHTSQTLFWTLFSIMALFLVLGLVVYIIHRYEFFYGEPQGVSLAEKLLQSPLTPSQIATGKFFLVAGLLFVAQIFMGGLLAHYTSHPGTFYIPVIAELIPYSLAKSWHLQLAIFWIAISWIGTAILVSPFIAGKEPRYQRLLVNILFIAAFVVVAGSLLGEAAGIKGMLGKNWYWLGHQGWEYLELGKLWQILLFGGLVFWLIVVYRPLASYLKNQNSDPDQRALVIFYVLSAIMIVAFFSFGLFYGKSTHISIADYWRWFVVHIWVESIFEFFGVAITAMFLVSLGLVSAKSALRVAYLTAILVFVSGIPGTAHHYFWYGGPSFWLAIGGVFSSMEPVPLITLVTRAWMEYSSIRKQGKEFPYRWPLYFLVASSFWNFLGAGVFGFLINLPIVNYYEHATYLTSNHGHTALFGVYGMLAISLILFSWRSMVQNKYWKEGVLKVAFWGLNGGLFLMFSTSLLPVGLMQLWNVYEKGFWFARSAEFYELPWVKIITLWRMVPDLIIIILGAFPLVSFLIFTFLRIRKPASESLK